MAVECRATAGYIEAEVESLAGGGIRDLLLHLACALDADPVLLRDPRRAVALTLSWGGGIQLEAAPGHADVVAVLELGERSLEPALSDVAPWARNVRPDLDVH
jgi:hypothetical protein